MAITALPTPPTRSDPATFSTRGDAFMAALPAFATEANALAVEVSGYATTATTQAGIATTKAGDANTSAIASAASAATAVAAPGTSASSTTSLLISVASKSLTCETGKQLVVGMQVVIARTSAPTNWMAGTITAYTSGTGALVVNVTTIAGSGTFTDWTISISGVPGSTTLTNFTEGRTVAAPNATIPVHSVIAAAVETNVDVAIVPKGSGNLAVAIADNLATGGNKRGTNAIDLQKTRAAATQVASGNNSFLGAGINCTASGTQAAVLGGNANTATSTASTSIGGNTNAATGTNSAILGGSGNTTSGDGAIALGGTANTVSGLYAATIGSDTSTNGFQSAVVLASKGGVSRSVNSTIKAAAAAGSQTGNVALRCTTAGAVSARMTADGAAASASNIYALANNTAAVFLITVILREPTGPATKIFTGTALLRRQASAAATVLVGTPSFTSAFGDASLSGASLTVSADTTLGGLNLQANGVAALNLVWTASIEVIEAN